MNQPLTPAPQPSQTRRGLIRLRTGLFTAATLAAGAAAVWSLLPAPAARAAAPQSAADTRPLNAPGANPREGYAGDYTPIVDVMSDVQVIKQENYNVVAHLTPAGSTLRARLVLDQIKGDNFQYVDFILNQGKRSLEYGISEGGVERALARSLEIPDAPATPATAPAAPLGYDLSVRRRGFQTAILVNGEVALTSLAPAAPPVNNEFDAKKMGFTGAYKVLTGKGQFDRVEMTELESILFNDGFMRAETQSDNWQLVRGADTSFKVESLRNPLLSANAFVQLGYGKGSMLMIGRPEWDNYDYSVSLRGPWEASMGMVLCALEPGKTNGEGIKFATNKAGRKYDPDARYLVFEWKSNDHRPVGDPAVTPENKDLARRAGEMTLAWIPGDPDEPKVEMLAQKVGGYLPNQWYRVHAQVAFGKANLYIDNHLEMTAENPAIAGGRIGLFCDVKEPPAGLYGANHEFSLNSMHQLLQYYGAWDDVEVRSTKAVGADYSGENNLWVGSHAGRPVTPLILAEGTVTPLATDKPAPAEPPAAPAGLRIAQGNQVVWGSPEWSNQVYTATVDLTAADRAGLFYNYISPANFTAVVLDKTAQRVSFGRFRDGKWTELDSAPAKLENSVSVALKPQDRYLHVAITTLTAGGATAGSIDLHAYAFPGDSKPLPAADKKSAADFTALAAQLPAQASADQHGAEKGRIGFFADQGVLAVLSFAVDPVQKDAVFTTSSAIFGHEETMSAWNSFSSEWITQKDRETGSIVYWHQAFFPGDVAIKVHPVSFDKPNYEVALSVAKTAKKAVKNNGYVLMFTAGERKVDTQQKEPVSHKLTVKLLRDNEPVCESACAVQGDIAQFSIRRAGPYLIGGINDQIVIAWRDPQPLEGNKVAYKVTGVTLADADTQITSNDIDDQRFEQAPTDWRTSLYGILEITNRWQCDPRWSFCSLFAPSIEVSAVAAQAWPAPKRIACMWNKKEYTGDVVVELYAGTKMNKDRGGNYQYRRDMNIQLASDGKSLSKGYTVMYGGMQNQGTYILKDGQIVFQDTAASAQINYNQGSMHRHWFFIRIEKVGSTIKMSVDGAQKIMTGTNDKPVTGWVDDKPLEGNRIAIWTYDNGLMIGRVRISGDGGKTWETPNQEYSADEDCPDKN